MQKNVDSVFRRQEIDFYTKSHINFQTVASWDGQKDGLHGSGMLCCVNLFVGKFYFFCCLKISVLVEEVLSPCLTELCRISL